MQCNLQIILVKNKIIAHRTYVCLKNIPPCQVRKCLIINQANFKALFNKSLAKDSDLGNVIPNTPWFHLENKVLQSNSIIVESITVENSIIVDNLSSTEDFYLIKIQNRRNSKIVEVFLGKVA